MARKDKVLITGGSGFIGANLARFFLSRGHDVAVLLRPKSQPWRIKDIVKDLSVCLGDITDVKSLRKTVLKTKPGIIIHAASYGGNSGESDTQTIYRVNFQGTRGLVEACADHDYRVFINTGTSSEYGKKSTPMNEADVLAPITDYGVSKAAASLFLACWAKRGKRPIVTLRLFSPYGYYEDGARLIPSVVLPGLRNEPAYVSSPKNVRDFIFIDDVMNAYEKAVVGCKKIQGEMINVGSGVEHSVGDVVSVVLRYTRSQARPVWGALPSRPFEPGRWQADIKKAKSLLGWAPRNSLADGLKKSVIWFKTNSELYKRPL